MAERMPADYLFQIDGDAVLAVDGSCVVMSCNAAAEQLFGGRIRPGAVFLLEEHFRAPFLGQVKTAIQAAIATGALTRDVRIQIADRPFVCGLSAMPLLFDEGRVIGVVLSFQPMAVSPQIGKAHPVPLKKAELEHETFLEALPEGLFTVNTRWRIASFNRAAEEITGYRRTEVIGRYCWEIFRSDVCKDGCPMRTAMETGHSCIDQDVRMIKKDGVRQTILVSTGVLRDKSGTVAGAVETFRLLAGEIRIPQGIRREDTFDRIIGRSAAMKRIFSILPDVAASDVNVLIGGESGTGKDLLARTIHNHSPRRDHPYVAVNCAALPETLLESELFGHEKAAFTGALTSKPGRFELVQGGTLFLDEIGELRPELQIKLLRVLEQREFERVGGIRSIPLEARVISATNRDLKAAIRDGSFREDFYYRLRTIPITIPPLRERREDIPPLVDFFIHRLNRRTGKSVRSLDAKVMRFFMEYTWPGNVRELERTLEHAFVFVKGSLILLRDLPAAEEFACQETGVPVPEPPPIDPRSRESITWALSCTMGHRQEAADLLGISRTSLWRRMKELGLA